LVARCIHVETMVASHFPFYYYICIMASFPGQPG